MRKSGSFVALLLVGCGARVSSAPHSTEERGAVVLSSGAKKTENLPLEARHAASLAKSEAVPVPPEPLPETEPPCGDPLPHLRNFYARLRSLRLREGEPDAISERAKSLRIEWFGDSHTAADFLTDVVRRRLFEFARPGGPGFLRVGLKDGRHGQAKFSLSGRFRHQPFLPAQREVFEDGVFGFAGLRTIPTLGASFALRAKDAPDEGGEFRVELRLRKGDRLVLRVGEERREVKGPFPDDDALTGEIGFAAPLKSQLSVEFAGGEPEILGAWIESTKPGVVLDTIGINGARAATMLAWDERSFVESMRRRGPDLVALAFGTNEAFDGTPLSRYPGEYAAVLGRVRAAVPGIECLLIGPPDAEARSGGSLERVAKIAEQLAAIAVSENCAFIDSRALMGGEGSFAAFRNNSPSWARADRVHLTIAGYEELGRRIADVLLPPANTLALEP